MGSKRRDSELAGPRGWPVGARWVVSLVLIWHASAVLAGAFGFPPSSRLEQGAADFFKPYHEFLDQGDSYRYYSTAFPPTPVVTATLNFADGRPEKVVRLPERGLQPRLLYQRQLALANGLMEDFQAARSDQGPYQAGSHEGHNHPHSPLALPEPDGGRSGDGSRSRWARAFATHLGQVNPGCSSVTLRLQMHMVPRIERIQEELDRPRRKPVDLDAEEFYTAPERIGEYPCDAS